MLVLGSLVTSAPVTSMHDAGNPVGYHIDSVLRKNVAGPVNVPDTETRLENESESMENYMETVLLARLDEISRIIEELRGDMINSGRISTYEATAIDDMKSQFQRVFFTEAPQDYVHVQPPTSTMVNIGAIISAAINACLALFGSMSGGIIGAWIQASIQRRTEAAMKLVEERAKAVAEQAASAVAQRVESAAEEVRETAVKMKSEMEGRRAEEVEGIVEGAVEGTIIGLAKGVEEANLHASSSTDSGTLIGDSTRAKD
ncbi:uncharacterized protein STEHIDRAFT_157930 [Stereum hirsutum FP-91666 SS1]|uniref:uncharacterized protein n=1 Tax=Stereum hirsutum (strain FP-91666) TaxID=721885 RepID=UPI0004449528|nr:uncharacterized protein STEHIDRAFT_157930 [Stereum hirsutum FP-91666 SS1]EIM85289.1 hypothetical protein STEHIDRAFT_157930 [Stereum hirsutum FP-91666 SS1]